MATATRAHRLEPLARALHLRLALFFAAAFGMVGVFIPFWPLWLEGRGFTPAEMGVMWAAGTWARVAIAPVLGNHADLAGDKRPLLRWLGCLALACGCLFVPRLGFAGVLVVMVGLSSVHAPLISLVDGLTVEAARRLTPRGIRFDYAHTRLWGSVAFLGVNVAAGWLLTGRSSELVLGVLLPLLLLVAATSFLLPHLRSRGRTARAPVVEVLRHRPFLLLLLAAGLIQGSHACYYAYSTLHWENAGLSRGTIGLLWSEGVVAEIVIFALGARFAAVSPVRLLLLGGAAAALRWGLTAHTTSLAALAAVQWMHALSFGVTHLAAIRWIARHVPSSQVASAQALYGAVTAGIGPGIATPLCGPLFAAQGGDVFVVMAAMAAAGLLCALALRR